ncbi:hypothetical protein PVAND_009706 [Polypedilum vanderplanki]|uniref:Major facilitator superfamily (MFS) profile domain-containing protein n=1 Tax=Polypedilum vanderplanki TaxID=319348 RepID=A0A9J6CE24_POLVA|nr:hypothetical protein PVAND_009706 [Polypedilum vanderplanki]
MKIKVSKDLLPIKAHYFFFMGSLGPILPQMVVFGRQLGVSPTVMGFFLSMLPFLYFFAKPLVGMLADYFTKARKLIFLSLVAIMTLSYAGYIFLPQQTINNSFNVTDVPSCDFLNEKYNDRCLNYHTVICEIEENNYQELKVTKLHGEIQLCHKNGSEIQLINKILKCRTTEDIEAPSCFYKTATFWIFIFLTYMGTIGFNVGNSISDAICFDLLGEDRQMEYGQQRIYGSIGFGITSLIAGYAMDINGNDFTPAILIMLAFGFLDMFSIIKLKLPKLYSSESILKDVSRLLRHGKIVIFLIFATIAGIFDSFIFYYMFWHLEDVAEKAGMKDHVKLIEGMTVAAECLFGEVLFFLISGRIIKKLGYIHCLSFCFFCYTLRMFFISLMTNPWQLVFIEILMQGCTYALCYTCIVAYASVISPPGTSATVQGVVAGMDDGLGFSIGSIIGGFLFQKLGGKRSFQIFTVLALMTCIAHIILRPVSTEDSRTNNYEKNDKSRTNGQAVEEEKLALEVL